MSIHSWVHKHLPTYLAGGLNERERWRLERHLPHCADCTRALDEVRALDEQLGALFAADRPQPALEDRMIRSLRQVLPRRRVPLFFKVLAGAAAALLLAALGAGLSLGLDPEHAKVTASRQKRTSKPASGISFGDFSGAFLMPTASSAPKDGGESDGYRVDGRSQLGLNQSGGTILTFEDREGDETKDVNQMAQEFGEGLKHRLKIIDGSSKTINANGHYKADGGIFGRETKKRQEGADGIPGLGTKDTHGDDTRKGEAKQPTYPAGTSETPPGKFSKDGKFEVKGHGVTTWNTGGRPSTALEQRKPAEAKEGEKKGKEISSNSLGWYRPGGDALSEEKQFKEFDKKRLEKGNKGLEGKDHGKSDDGEASSKKDPGTEKKPGDSKGGEPAIDFAPVALPAQPPQPKPAPGRKIIRTGTIDFEVDSFDDSVSIIIKLVGAAQGGYIATVNSDKLPNGKVKGSVVVRVPPELLDKLVQDLRKELGKKGELKGQRITSQDITKQYFDLESRLKAAKTMEERLLDIIRKGKGEIKDLLAVEKELGIWRTRIEEMEGELKYYANQVSLSTLTIDLQEKEIRQAAAITESERVQAGIEVDDVEKAQQQALKDIADLKGRVTKSELKQRAAGQFEALLHFEVAPDKALLMRDRLRQLGTMVRLETDRVQETPRGHPAPKIDGKIERGNTKFIINIYNLANIAPRETVTLKLAATDVAAAYNTLREVVAKAKGRVVTAQLNEQDQQNITGQLDFSVMRPDEGKVRMALADAGAVLSRQITRAPEGDAVTDAKVLYRIELVSAANIPARKTYTLTLDVAKVNATLDTFTNKVKQLGGRVLEAKVDQENTTKASAHAVYEVPLVASSGVVQEFKGAGQVRVQNVTDNPQAPEGKLALARIDVSLSTVNVPRKTFTLGIEVSNVDTTLGSFADSVKTAGGRIVDSTIGQERNGRITARAVYDVPLAAAPGLVEKFKNAGAVRVQRVTENQQAPEGALALARIDVTVSNEELLVPEDQGMLSQIRWGLGIGLRALWFSLSFIIIALLFVLPWVLVIYVIVWLSIRLFRRRPAVVMPVPAAAAPTGGGGVG
jgi:hypothetical protein